MSSVKKKSTHQAEDLFKLMDISVRKGEVMVGCYVWDEQNISVVSGQTDGVVLFFGRVSAKPI
jgi:hypothetical protein